jgi:hypothetical protein
VTNYRVGFRFFFIRCLRSDGDVNIARSRKGQVGEQDASERDAADAGTELSSLGSNHDLFSLAIIFDW